MESFEPTKEEIEEAKAAEAEGRNLTGADGKKTVFFRHPVSPAVKKKVVTQGHRILAEEFAPAGVPIYNGQTGRVIGSERQSKPAGKGGKSE